MPNSKLFSFVRLAYLPALLGACTAAAPPLKPAKPPQAAAQPPTPKPAKERLLAALRQVERPRPLLELLQPEALAVLDTRLAALSPEQKEQLLHGELSSTMPLLHVRAGGGQGAAFLALAISPAALVELPSAFESAENASVAERSKRVQLARELQRRAAQHFLRDRVLDIANAPAAALPALVDVVTQAARAAARPDLERLALETAVDVGAGPDVMAELGSACAFDQDETCLSQAEKAVPESAPQHARLLKLRRALKLRSDGDPIVKGWALLQLGRYADAARALAPVSAKSKTDLRVATGLAVAAFEGSACPGLYTPASLPRLCADAIAIRPELASALSDMNSAWQSEGGRDAPSAEAYVGLAHVVPWVSALSLATSPASLERELTERHAAMARVLAALPEQKAFSVFAAAVTAGITAGLHAQHGERPQLESNRKQELWFGALGVEAPAPRLAVAAVLASDQSVAQLVPAAAPESLLPARAGILVWEASSGGEPGVVEQARAALAEQLTASPKGSTDAALAVLLLAELDAQVQPGERAYGTLAQVSSQLLGQSLPPELALRAVLDAAGALERLGRSADALGVLSKAAEIQAIPGPSADLLGVIRAEKLVLEWDQKKDPKRVALAKALFSLDLASASPALAAAVTAWSGQKPHSPTKVTLLEATAQSIGQPSAKLLSKGTLRGTSVSMRVSYDFQLGIEPALRFDPRLIPLVRADLIQKAL